MRAALYIDCGSIKVEDIPYIYEEIRKTDDLVISKMFGVEMKDASEIAGRLRIRNNLHCGGDQTSALVALAVEVMADAIDEDVQKTYIATGDLAVLPLLDKLKLMRTSVVVIGPCGADRALIDNSEKYTYLEVINGGECTAEIPSVDEIAGRIYSVSSYYNGMGEDVELEQVYKSLIRRYPDFDVRNYGYTHLSTFVKKNVSGVQVVNDDRGGSCIKIVDDRKNIDDFAYEYVADRGYTIDDMAELIDALREKFPGFAMENYGYHTDYGFILSFSRFQIWENKGIKMKRSFKLSSRSDEETEEL
ncbi:hypothetical protein DWX94_02435 [Coprococcus eutactus]|uniref:HTH OST-type domain-containing protein n=1 Tax=Coprococcus eutactus TaxID=33043 RepID=A0A412IV46_9FIRM|nr:hypothetical protein DWX94_02435 [Coprococcus eutactus]